MISAVLSLLLFSLVTATYPLAAFKLMPPAQGTLANEILRFVGVPLILIVMVGGGLAAARALSEPTTDAERMVVAIAFPPGVLWVFFAVCAFMLPITELTFSSAFYLAYLGLITGAMMSWMANHVRKQHVLTI